MSEISIDNFNPNDEFFDDLKHERFVLFLGAGFSCKIRNSAKKSDLPLTSQFLIEEYQNIPTSKQFIDLTNSIYKTKVDTYQLAANVWGNNNYSLKLEGSDERFNLDSFFRNLFTPDPETFFNTDYNTYKNILLPRWKGIYTFNFDTVLETIVKQGKQGKSFSSLSYPNDPGVPPRQTATHIAHLHGIITCKRLESLVFGNIGYTKLTNSKHTLYNNFHTEVNNLKKLLIIGTQFAEQILYDQVFCGLSENISIYHFDISNNNSQHYPLQSNFNYQFIRINDTTDLMSFFERNQNLIDENNFSDYLNVIITNEDTYKINKLYINLLGRENLSYLQLESVGIELLSDDYKTSYTYINSQNNEIFGQEEQDIPFTSKISSFTRDPKVDSILNIEKETRSFIIVGAPGSGKTTTLKKILFQNSKRILEEQAEIKVPVYILANEFKNNQNFINLISKSLEVDNCIPMLQKGKLQLLIDGLNEIDRDKKHNAYREIKKIINNYPNISIILSTRKTGFINEFNIPVFELKELQETEIEEFISEHIPNNPESVWDDLQSNDKLFELARNPMYLTMLVIASKDGIIPQNRGALFEKFVNELLTRDGILETRANAAIDVLSGLAFALKKAGTFSFPTELATKIITDQIKNSYYGSATKVLLGDIYMSELISKKPNSKFVHEAFLDFFAAVHIKKQFNSRLLKDAISIQDIGINDITEPIWYEPLILCGDLYKTKDEYPQAVAYFELLHKGTFNKTKKQKQLLEFRENDFNDTLKISCKVAYNLKNLFPQIYEKAEKYVLRTMQLWLYHYYYNNYTILLPLEKLFEAISALGSKELLESILFSNPWQQVWLYYGNKDEGDGEKDKGLPTNPIYVIEKHQGLVDAIVHNISDFEALCQLLYDEKKLYSCNFHEIKERINFLRDSLLESSSIINLKTTYLNRVSDLGLLRFIGKVDPVFFISSYDMSKDGIDKYASSLLQLTRFNIVKQELMKIIDFLTIDDSIEVIIALFKVKFFKPSLDWLESRIKELNYSEEHYERLKSALMLVPLDLICDKLQEYFFPPDKIFSAQYNITNIIKEKRIIVRLLQTENLQSLTPNSELILNNKVICRLLGVNIMAWGYTKKEKFTLNNKTHKYRNYIGLSIIFKIGLRIYEDNIPQSGIAQVFDHKKNQSLFSSNYKLLNRGYKSIEIVFNDVSDIEIFLGMKSLPIVLNHKLKGTINQIYLHLPGQNILEKKQIARKEIDFSRIEEYEVNLSLELKPNTNLELINKCGSIKINNPWKDLLNKIHPDDYIRRFLASDEKTKHDFTSEEFNSLARLGLLHKFHNYLYDVDYGIVTSKYNLSISILSLKNKATHDKVIPKGNIHNYSVNQIVVIENNKTAALINEKDQESDKIGYITERITRIDKDNNEGHIFKSTKSESCEKDYYFHFEDCNFSPNLGDIVRFIPSINIFPSSFGLPKAYRISKIEDVNTCRLNNINYDPIKSCVHGIANDTQSKEELKFTITNMHKINKSTLELGAIFSYQRIGSISSKLNWIKLLEKIS